MSEIIKCKDCKWWQRYDPVGVDKEKCLAGGCHLYPVQFTHATYSNVQHPTTHEDDFCSKGEL